MERSTDFFRFKTIHAALAAAGKIYKLAVIAANLSCINKYEHRQHVIRRMLFLIQFCQATMIDRSTSFRPDWGRWSFYLFIPDAEGLLSHRPRRTE
jgi:hypothetical protein